MTKTFAMFSFPVLILLCLANFSLAQESIAIGQIEHIDDFNVMVVGNTGAYFDEARVDAVELTDENGNVDFGLLYIEQDGGFALFAPAFLTIHATMIFVESDSENGTGESMMILLDENRKKLPKNELDKIDAHKFKKDVVGNAGGEYDIYWDTSETDKDKRKIKLIKISDTSVIVDSHETWGDVKDEYPKDDESNSTPIETP
jgi:hypothetical protein